MVFDGLNSTSKKENYLYKKFYQGKRVSDNIIPDFGTIKAKIKLFSDLQQRQKFPLGISVISIANKNKINIRKLSLEVKSLSKIFTKKCIYGLGSIKKSLIWKSWCPDSNTTRTAEFDDFFLLSHFVNMWKNHPKEIYLNLRNNNYEFGFSLIRSFFSLLDKDKWLIPSERDRSQKLFEKWFGRVNHPNSEL